MPFDEVKTKTTPRAERLAECPDCKSLFWLNDDEDETYCSECDGVAYVQRPSDPDAELLAAVEKLDEARLIIRALLGAPPPRIWKRWPVIHARATRFLTELAWSELDAKFTEHTQAEAD